MMEGTHRATFLDHYKTLAYKPLPQPEVSGCGTSLSEVEEE